jgi:hypothetical protein
MMTSLDSFAAISSPERLHDEHHRQATGRRTAAESLLRLTLLYILPPA